MPQQNDMFGKPIAPSSFARDVSAKEARIYSAVLEQLAIKPLTADECADRLGFSVLSMRPMFTYMKQAGLIRDTNERRRNAVSGKLAAVWEPVPRA